MGNNTSRPGTYASDSRGVARMGGVHFSYPAGPARMGGVQPKLRRITKKQPQSATVEQPPPAYSAQDYQRVEYQMPPMASTRSPPPYGFQEKQ